MILQSAIRFLYPPQCLSCGKETQTEGGVCGTCWRDLAFIAALVCDSCGTPLPGEDTGDPVLCDQCLSYPMPWHKGRAAFEYSGTARKLVLALKHGDRQDLAGPMAAWMMRFLPVLKSENTLIAPVPLHWKRMFRRRFNQAALIAGAIAKKAEVDYVPDLICRNRPTRHHEHMTRAERFENQRGAFHIRPRYHDLIRNRPVLLIDDVMTTGATLAACTEACLAANAELVNVLVLARVAPDT